MGMKYLPTAKDNKLDQRYHTIARRKDAPAIVPGTRLPKKLTKKAAARLAAETPPPEETK
jgi:hypothetical protein